MSSINFHDLTFNVTDITQLDTRKKKQLFKIFNSFGFLLIESNDPEKSQENFISLSHLFGNILRHDQSDEQGIFPITVMSNFPNYANTTNTDLTLHTDGSFEKVPPKVMAMHCEVAANHGGLTQLVDGKLVYEYLSQTDPEGLMTLFEPDIFTIKRANQSATRSIFTNKNGRIYIAFRSDKIATISVHHRAIKAFTSIKNFVNNPANQIIFKLQPNQILVFDNNRILHGRTGFKINDKRKLNGLWFDGNCQYSSDLDFGFVAANQNCLQKLLNV